MFVTHERIGSLGQDGTKDNLNTRMFLADGHCSLGVYSQILEAGKPTKNDLDSMCLIGKCSHHETG